MSSTSGTSYEVPYDDSSIREYEAEEAEDKETRKKKKETPTPEAKQPEAEAETEADEPNVDVDDEPESNADADDEPDAEEQQADADAEDDSEQKRERTRQTRKEKRQREKERRDAERRELQELRAENQAMREGLSRVEQRMTAADMSRLDDALGAAQRNVELARQKRMEARESGDTAAEMQHEEAMYGFRRQAEELATVKQRAQQHYQQAQQPQPQQADNRAAIQYGNDFRARNTWYDPQGNDADSALVDRIDSQMVREGRNPNDAGYWSELESRLRGALPHRYGGIQPAVPRKKATPGGGHNATRAGGDASEAGFGVSNPTERAAKSAWINAGIWQDAAKRKAAIAHFRKLNGRT